MNRFSTLTALLASVSIVASCGQLIGLSDYEKGEEEAEGGQGASGGKGGASGGKAGSTTGGKGGASGGKGGTSGGKGGNGGKGGTTGGSSGDAGDGGSPDGGVGGSNGGNSGKGGASGNGGSSAVGGDSGNGGTAGSGGASGGASGGGGTAGTAGCVELTPGVALAMSVDPPDPDFRSVVYDYAIDEQVGSALDDILGIQVYSGTGYDGQLTGTFTLGTGVDDNYSTCGRCILIERDITAIGNAGAKRFYANSGTLVVDAASQQMDGRPIMTMDDVTLIEVTIAGAPTYESTPVPNGECYHIANFSFTLPTAGWTCDPSVWGDNFCTCGCGTRDLECDSPASDACVDCAVAGSCANSCLDIAPDNNAICGASAPAGWTCDVLAYGDAVCNCGCGVPDPDCLSTEGWACDYFDNGCGAGSCGAYDCIGIDLTQNHLCSSTGWTCPVSFYNALDGCDCGCGIVDPDCDGPTGACTFCDNPGACSLYCTDIDPTDNSQCL